MKTSNPTEKIKSEIENCKLFLKGCYACEKGVPRYYFNYKGGRNVYCAYHTRLLIKEKAFTSNPIPLKSCNERDLDRLKAQLSQRQEDLKLFVELLEEAIILPKSFMRSEFIQQKLTELKQEIN